MPYVDANGVRFYYQDAGEGEPVVYVHGGFAGLDSVLSGSAWDWERHYPTYFRFITYDRRGCGLASSPNTGYDLVSQARDLAELLDALGVPNAHVIGSSAGGPIAMYFAALYPLRVRSLILAGTALDLCPVGEAGSDMVRKHLVLLERDGAEAAFDARPVGVEFSFNELWDEPEAIARGKLDVYRARVQQFRERAKDVSREKRVHYYATELRSMQAYMTTEIRAYAQAVLAPTFILHGSNDKMVPLQDAQELLKAIPGAQLQVIEGGSHSLLSQNVQVRDTVAAWVQRFGYARQ